MFRNVTRALLEVDAHDGAAEARAAGFRESGRGEDADVADVQLAPWNVLPTLGLRPPRLANGRAALRLVGLIRFILEFKGECIAVGYGSVMPCHRPANRVAVAGGLYYMMSMIGKRGSASRQAAAKRAVPMSPLKSE